MRVLIVANRLLPIAYSICKQDLRTNSVLTMSAYNVEPVNLRLVPGHLPHFSSQSRLICSATAPSDGFQVLDLWTRSGIIIYTRIPAKKYTVVAGDYFALYQVTRIGNGICIMGHETPMSTQNKLLRVFKQVTIHTVY